MKRMMLFSLCFIFSVNTFKTYGQMDTIQPGKHWANPEFLKQGSAKYLVYSEDSATGVKLGASLWKRTTSFEKLNGRDVIAIRQEWMMLDTMNTKREVISYMDYATFLPVHHHTILTASRGRHWEEAFDFGIGVTKAPDSLKVNNQNFEMATKQPVFNWELDLETFAQLPLKANRTFIIPFYHPGSKTPPDYYTYKVEGKDTIEGLRNHFFNCWRLVYRDEKTGNYSTWWIDKKSHTILKMKENYNGKFRYKILMAI